MRVLNVRVDGQGDDAWGDSHSFPEAVSSCLSLLLATVEKCSPSFSTRRITPSLARRVLRSPEFATFSARVATFDVADTSNLSHDLRVATFVNLYNLILLHAFLIDSDSDSDASSSSSSSPSLTSSGPTVVSTNTPTSSPGVLRYVQGAGYAVGLLGTVTPFDIEHYILRSPSSRPSFLGASLIMAASSSSSRTSTLGSVQLEVPEPLISFVLACGARTSPVPRVLDPHAPLQLQLADAASAYLASTVVPNRLVGSLVLPKLLDWYRDDFAPSGGPEPVLSPSDGDGLISVLRPLLPPRLRFEVDQLFKGNATPKVKFAEWDWTMYHFRPPFLGLVSPLYAFEGQLSWIRDTMSRSLSTLLQYMREELPLATHKRRFKTYRSSFSGQDAVDWLYFVARGYNTRDDAVMVLTQMLRAGALISTAPDPYAGDLTFQDKSSAFYTFQYPWDEYVLRANYRAELATFARSLAESVAIQDRTYHRRVYPSCFLGSEAVDAILSLEPLFSRHDAIVRGVELLHEGFIYHVAFKQNFDDKHYFFRFRPGLVTPLATSPPPGLEHLPIPPPFDDLDSVPDLDSSAAGATADGGSASSSLETIYVNENASVANVSLRLVSGPVLSSEAGPSSGPAPEGEGGEGGVGKGGSGVVVGVGAEDEVEEEGDGAEEVEEVDEDGNPIPEHHKGKKGRPPGSGVRSGVRSETQTQTMGPVSVKYAWAFDWALYAGVALVMWFVGSPLLPGSVTSVERVLIVPVVAAVVILIVHLVWKAPASQSGGRDQDLARLDSVVLNARDRATGVEAMSSAVAAPTRRPRRRRRLPQPTFGGGAQDGGARDGGVRDGGVQEGGNGEGEGEGEEGRLWLEADFGGLDQPPPDHGYYGDLQVSLIGHGPIPLNEGPILFESETFRGSIDVRVKDAEGAPVLEYWEGRRRNFAIVVTGEFKQEFGGDELYFGSRFSGPLRVPFGASMGIRFAKLIDPGLEADLSSNTPSIVSPLLCSMNELEGPNVVDMPSPERRKYYKARSTRQEYTFVTGVPYRFEAYGDVLNWNTFRLAVGPLRISAVKYLNGQPVHMQIVAPGTGQVVVAVRFDHRELQEAR